MANQYKDDEDVPRTYDDFVAASLGLSRQEVEKIKREEQRKFGPDTMSYTSRDAYEDDRNYIPQERRRYFDI